MLERSFSSGAIFILACARAMAVATGSSASVFTAVAVGSTFGGAALNCVSFCSASLSFNSACFSWAVIFAACDSSTSRSFSLSFSTRLVALLRPAFEFGLLFFRG